MSDILRKWQRNAREKVQVLRAQGIDRALIAACPGAGKTKYAISLIVDDLVAGVIECAIIVVPSRIIKRLWKDAFKTAGITAFDDIDNGTLEDHQARGMALIDPARPVFIVTYQQVSARAAAEIFAVVCARHKVFAVFDEIHHVTEDAEFGRSLVAA